LPFSNNTLPIAVLLGMLFSSVCEYLFCHAWQPVLFSDCVHVSPFSYIIM